MKSEYIVKAIAIFLMLCILITALLFPVLAGEEYGSDEPANQDMTVTRAEAAAMLFELLSDDVLRRDLTSDHPFTDVPTSHWANTVIATMHSLGVVRGRAGNIFDPEAPVTRAEFAVMCARFDSRESEGWYDVADTAGHWAQHEIERAVILGWLGADEQGNFRPDEKLKLDEAVNAVKGWVFREYIGSIVN